ncbi:metalloprotease TIKI homolog isoform X1 [Rhopilema esculentum]|uniref:metalloprotease TIKI homolog isoform X1 n=1 Tax=Rhopilema esculentum TaxID=499914 RepID=UPI0031DE4DC5
MENNMEIILWRDILITFALWISARMVSGREKFTVKCVGKPANSHLWRLNQNPPSYLFGTIHYPWDVLWKNPNHIHKNVKYAFRKSQSIYTELDFSNVTTLKGLQKCRFLPGNLTLKNILPQSLLTRLRKHLEHVRRSFESWLPKNFNTAYPRALAADYLYSVITQNWKRKRPVWLVVLIMLELTPSNIKRQQMDILDLFLTKRAKQQGNSIGGLETAEDQCDPFNSINNRQAIFLLNYTLHLQELIRSGKMKPEHESEQNKILKVYLCGNLEKGIITGSRRLLVNSNARHHVPASQVNKIIQIEEYLMKKLVYKRNVKMARRIDEILRANKSVTFFFAIGTGHLSGKSSVVELLKEKGHKIDHIKPLDMLAGQRRWEKRRERRRANRRRGQEKETLSFNFHRTAKPRVTTTIRTTVAVRKDRNKFGDGTVDMSPTNSTDNVSTENDKQPYVYYYTNSNSKVADDVSIMMVCLYLIYILRQVVT